MKVTNYFFVLLALSFIAGGSYWIGSRNHQKATVLADSETKKDKQKILYWYDPMSPATRFNKPGKSPFMDMELVPRYASESSDNDGVKISPVQEQNLGIRTADVILENITRQISAYGVIDTDEGNLEIIPARANALVEKLYVNASQQYVKKNQPLAKLWIPQWAASQKEYLAVRTLGDASLTKAARQRLELMFMPQNVILDIEHTGKPQTHITLYAPHEGYISKLNVRVGAEVTASQPIFELSTLNPVWLLVNYPQNQASLLSVGDQIEATTASWPGTVFKGEISELLPTLDMSTRTLNARVVMKNPDHLLKPGMYMNVRLSQAAQGKPVLTIPEESLIVTGTSNRVIVTDGQGSFHPTEVVTGQTQDGRIEIKSGLRAGQKVVTSGQFLIDSEASLSSALPQLDSGSTPSKLAEAGTYTTSGVIKTVSSGSVTISHQPVPALKWPAMSMNFQVAPQQSKELREGEKVMFSFSMDEQGPKITSVMPVENKGGQ